MGKVIRVFLITLVIISAILEETEARRKILRGRKTLNRHYMRPSAIPAWAMVTLVGIGQLVFGALLYIFFKTVILDRSLKPRYVPAPMTPPEETQSA